MTNITSDGINQFVSRRRFSVRTGRDIITQITFIDMVLIVPSVVAFLALNFNLLIDYGLSFYLILTAFLLYLPLVIVFAGVLLSRGYSMQAVEKANRNMLYITLFLLLVFSVFGIYIPLVEKLTEMIPAFGSLNLMGGSTVFLNLLFILKNVSRMINP